MFLFWFGLVTTGQPLFNFNSNCVMMGVVVDVKQAGHIHKGKTGFIKIIGGDEGLDLVLIVLVHCPLSEVLFR